MALIRYPGSKEKLTRPILRHFPDEICVELLSNRKQWEYREPFFGAGAIGLKALRHLDRHCSVWLNDLDPGMAALWTSVRDHTKELIRRIAAFDPTPEEAARCFYRFKEEDGRADLPIDEIGFRKLALHRLSFSGLGYMAGGPIGGREQSKAAYTANCRWNRETMTHEIVAIGKLLKSFDAFRFTTVDFEELVRDAPRECFIYADPPYVEKGPALYKHSMDEWDHARLHDALRETESSWVLSYDDHDLIRRFYADWTRIEDANITYTMAITDKIRPKNREVVITPIRDLAVKAG